ncbi:DUF4297 domain-containing protein [Shewanella sp. C32]|uniref:DUF4297 domain-containing protein n=1 Tax=Shewanella electrica TaxID=515560 RepID=A0ABT2FQ74_9GAMM|nr:dsDNA nuclease domain-containing protein [Shewanella electrica]MCH1926904.1 DUF4297 domain-containing protein [Shewanella electrica]MCS4558506.1 DUF4297 domain-containing protein [Shewanella electrica]
MSISSNAPREQNGRDSFARYRAQVKSAAIESLKILEGQDIDKVYCDFQDDFVVRKINGESHVFLFYQVKTKNKQNYNWTVNDLFKFIKRGSKELEENAEAFKDSFIGKLLVHTVIFDEECSSVIFQTNVNTENDVEEILEDISKLKFEDKYVKIILDCFNIAFKREIEAKGKEKFSIEEIKSSLSKLRVHCDVHYLKNGIDNFDSIAKEYIYKYSEVELSYHDAKEIAIKLLELISEKSSGVIKTINENEVNEKAGVGIEELLKILSISLDAYQILKESNDENSIKSVSIIQRSLSRGGASNEQIKFCSQCKTKWDIWLRNNRHIITDFEYICLTEKISDVVYNIRGGNGNIKLSNLKVELEKLTSELRSENLLFDLDTETLMGSFFSLIIKGVA